ncbi:hypothetical protein CBOM_07529 [Ceraceosorus bombacis]|uniref:Uncharacterized protein n=1 Tax=Ceraceosorus bombacis TaxID=401625 RepID=A0A0P1BEF5_9BASI|nr:hypothetical protein CBOM_07529 [Ceraceosorus bombacis]
MLDLSIAKERGDDTSGCDALALNEEARDGLDGPASLASACVADRRAEFALDLSGILPKG